ncbi:DUF1801 domain-containing protein [Thalassobellus citreus]|uniref:DUF1801 domain-containing protein n=1 Tax=Thalassobellus citreus TaxID=3367752 RepID=UPI003794429E
MQYKAKSPEDYISQVPETRQSILNKLRLVVNENLPNGFEEGIQYGMIGYFVPHSIYPAGYHCKPTEPLPFMSFASQKNSINFYHMGIYANPELYTWFVNEYPKHSKYKLDMGKSCIRFKKMEAIPFELIGELVSKMTVKDWITLYEANFNQSKK